MISFSEWIILREESSGAVASGGSAPAPSAPASSEGGSESSGGDSSPPSDSGSGTVSSDVARVPMRLGGCGFCYPYCSCSSCKKKRKKRKKRRKS